MFYAHLKSHLEALLFASGEPVSAAKLAALLEISQENLDLLAAQLNDDMSGFERGLTIVRVAEGYQLCTKPELMDTVSKLAHVQDQRLSAAALETLSIIAFKQPITKQEIELIRGVKVDRVIANLTERQLIRELGRKETIGRPIIYGTTADFLKCLGLNSLKDLPPLTELLPEKQP